MLGITRRDGKRKEWIREQTKVCNVIKSKKTEMAVGRACNKKNRPSLDQGDTRLDPKRYKTIKKQTSRKMKIR
ncbi:UNVERIFIED_CONTAM: hypothetical protein FKN15_016685 [Acipenser sinensis]